MPYAAAAALRTTGLRFSMRWNAALMRFGAACSSGRSRVGSLASASLTRFLLDRTRSTSRLSDAYENLPVIGGTTMFRMSTSV